MTGLPDALPTAALPEWRITEHQVLESTQLDIRSQLERGNDVHGVVVRALQQQRGRGRSGKTFVSPLGGSYQSFAIHDGYGGALARPDLTLHLAVVIAANLRASGAQVQLKWPNDLYLAGKKLGGILSEYLRAHLVVGVGLNVRNTPPDGAASLAGWDVSYVSDLVLAACGTALAECLASEEGATGLAERFGPFDMLLGRNVTVTAGNTTMHGTAVGIDDLGRLGLDLGTSGDLASRAYLASGSVVSWR